MAKAAELLANLRSRFSKQALFERTALAWLAAFRVLFGLTMFVSLQRFIAYGWLDRFFVEPSFHFKYWGFGWTEPFSSSGMYTFAWVLAGLALAVSLGFCFRIASLLFALGFTYLQLIDVTTYLNHYYLASLLAFLLAISPAHRAWSLDSVLRPRLRKRHAPVAWLYLFRFQIAVVYTYAGIAKLHSDWLLHGHPLSIWLGSHTDMPVLGTLYALPAVPLLMSWAGFLYDTTIAWWLLWSKSRPFAFATVILFHSLTSALFPIGMFPVIMVLSALVFFPADWPKRLFARARTLLKLDSSEESASSTVQRNTEVAPSSRGGGHWQRALLLVATAYCALQVLMPLRFLVYGGNVRWHEQGMRFSWRVMVREKNGSVTFIVRNKESGRIWHINPHRYLTPLQEREMSGQPDLILQLAHHIRDDFARRGLGPVEVRAEALVSLNGRKLARLIDPSIDLAQVTDGLARANWILPAPSEAPPQIRPLSAVASR